MQLTAHVPYFDDSKNNPWEYVETAEPYPCSNIARCKLTASRCLVF